MVNASSRLPRSLNSSGVSNSDKDVAGPSSARNAVPNASASSMKLIATMGGYIVEYQSASSDISQSIAANVTEKPSASEPTMLSRWSRLRISGSSIVSSRADQ